MVERFCEANAPEPGCDGDCPQSLLAAANSTLATFWRHAYDELGWRNSKKEASKSGVFIKSRPIPSSVANQFRAEATFRGVDARTLYESNLLENRRSWDPAVAKSGYLHRYKGPEGDCLIDIVCYVTKPQARGMVKGRSFLDLRVTRFLQTKLEDGSDGVTVFQALAKAPLDLLGSKGQDWMRCASEASFVEAKNLPGTGFILSEALFDGIRQVNCCQLCASEIGGRLPPSLINSVTGSVLLDLFLSMAKNIPNATLRPLTTPAALQIPGGEEAQRLKLAMELTDDSTDVRDLAVQPSQSPKGQQGGLPFLFVCRLGSMMCLCSTPDQIVADDSDIIQGRIPRN
mmetsp:Transcript_28/g.83  ORF Transcript_28/g.83 Transcript_28/m.83 type:complete len:344 (-) Transcript_28:38-1069(-)